MKSSNHLAACLGILPIAALLLMMAGCTSYEGKALNAVYHQHTDAVVKSYATVGSDALAEAVSSDDRNQKINDLLFLIDRNYEAWEKRLYDKKAYADFIGSTAILGLNAAGTLTGGTELKSILHALSGGIEGTRMGFDKDVLQNQNLLAIIAKMRALRAETLQPILRGMKEPLSTYTMSAALVDLGQYFNAGTFTAALQDITAQAGAEKKSNDAVNQNLKAEIKLPGGTGGGGGNKSKADITETFGKDDSSVALTAYWKPGGVVNPDHANNIHSFLIKKGLSVSIPLFIKGKEFAAARQEALAQLPK